MSFSPLNLYTFAAARGQFLRPDVQALLRNASVGPYSDFANLHDPILRQEAKALRKRLDVLLFGEPSYPVEAERADRRAEGLPLQIRPAIVSETGRRYLEV